MVDLIRWAGVFKASRVFVAANRRLGFAFNRKKRSLNAFQKGSILLEALVMLALIAVLTPILYTHVASKRQEVSNINKANTLLVLQRETEKFLRNPDTLATLNFTHSEPPVRKPSEISSLFTDKLDNLYKIGFKQTVDIDGNKQINALIVEQEGGNDDNASKIASMIGVSAGIKSSLDEENAYGINGLWKENLSSYGVNNIPDGSVVVTTEYNKEKEILYTSDMFVDSDMDLGDNALKAGSIVFNTVCIGGDDEEHCKNSWEEISDTAGNNMILVLKCYEDIENGVAGSEYCNKALSRKLLDDCDSIAKVYKDSGMQALSDYYWLGTSLTRKVCYFDEGNVPTTAKQVITACNDPSNVYRVYACMYDRQTGGYYAGGSKEGKMYTASCQSIYDAGQSEGYEFPTGYYTLTSDYSETGYLNGRATPCVFAVGKNANDAAETVLQCNNSTTENHAACARAFLDNRNGNCDEIRNSGVTDSAFYKVTNSASVNTSNYSSYNVTNIERACYFTSGSLANSSQAVTACNYDKAGSVSCGYAWQNGWNTSCASLLSVSYSYASSSSNTIMHSLKEGTNNQTCNVTNCNETTNYCTYNQSSQNKKYCNASVCSSVCDDDSDCSAYSSSTPYCIGGVCKSCGASGDIVSVGTKCCSGLYRTGSGTCGSCGNYAYDSKKDCYTNCSDGATHCNSTSYCSNTVCVSGCGVTGTGFNISSLSNRNCCSLSTPAAENGSCYPCTGNSQSACEEDYICNNYTCVIKIPAVCNSSTDIDNLTWLSNWSKCTACEAGQFQVYKSYYDSGSSCGYPTQITGCISIPSAGGSSYTTRSNSLAYGGGKYYYTVGSAYNQPIRNHSITISCNGSSETWSVVGPYVSWWEAHEICSRLGKNVPSTRSVLTNTSCGSYTRWSLLKTASPSRLNISSYPTYVWTEADYGNKCGAYLVGLSDGSSGYSPRTGAYYDTFAICGPNL